MNNNFAFNGATEVRRPQGSTNVPHGSKEWMDNIVWIKMRPIKLEYQQTSNKGGSVSLGNQPNPTFMFMAPYEIQENLNHTWEAYNSIQSRLAEKVREISKTTSEVKAIGGTFKDIAKSFKQGTSIKSLTNNILNKRGSIIPKVKVDTPLTYTNSQRRKWSFNFIIINETNNPKRDVVDPVQDLMKYSSPEMEGGYINIELPYIFSLSTYPRDYINATHTALESVQPTWKGPFIDGYPSFVDLTLSFVDLSPLFRSTISHGTVINVIED